MELAPNFMEKLKAEIKQELLIEEHMGDCFWCKWFILREEKPRNRVCRCPTPIVIKNLRCQSWELEENPKNRVKALC